MRRYMLHFSRTRVPATRPPFVLLRAAEAESLTRPRLGVSLTSSHRLRGSSFFGPARSRTAIASRQDEREHGPHHGALTVRGGQRTRHLCAPDDLVRSFSYRSRKHIFHYAVYM